MYRSVLISESELCSTTDVNRANEEGAVVTFSGYVREFSSGDNNRLTLSAYRPMTDNVLNDLVDEACDRWALTRVVLKHRIGAMNVNDLIVFIEVGSRHRQSAFEACQFLIDTLKTRAPFWKQESDADSSQWVKQSETDRAATDAWYRQKSVD